MALVYSQQRVVLREVKLSHKPQEMLTLSPKGTVPVLQLADGTVIEESLDIIHYALQQQDPDSWLSVDSAAAMQLIQRNDVFFKPVLDQYKYPDRHPTIDFTVNIKQAQLFLAELNTRLTQHAYLLGKSASWVDVAIFPFIRQFSRVDESYFAKLPYSGLQRWLDYWLVSNWFTQSMRRFSPWELNDPPVLFPEVVET